MPVETQVRQPNFLDTQPRPALIQIVHNLGENSALGGTGFNLAKEAGRFFENFNQNLRAGKTSEEALAVTALETEINIRTFTVEYVQTGAVLPNPSRIGQVNGVNRMVGDNGIPVVDGTTVKERKGSVLSALMVVDEAVSLSEPGQVAVINSPKGWSGFFAADGRPIKYKNSQTMVHWIDATGGLRNITIVSDLEQDQSERLSLDLEVTKTDLKGLTEEEKVAAIVAHPALLFFPEFKVSPAEYVLDRILAIRGNSPFRLEQEDGAVEMRSVEDIKKQIQNPDQLLKFNQDCEDYLLILRQFIMAKVDSLDNPDTQMEIVRGIERTILNITLDYMQNVPSNPDSKVHPVKKNESEAVWISGHNWAGFTETINYDQADALKWNRWFETQRLNETSAFGSDGFDKAAAFLRTRAGCNGGGGSRLSRGLGRGSTGISTSSISATGESVGGICKKCGGSEADDHYHCDNDKCNKKYDSETDLAPEQRTKQCICGVRFGC